LSIEFGSRTTLSRIITYYHNDLDWNDLEEKMNKVDQSIVDKEYGDCTRACIATILDLPLDAVPNFMQFKDKWFKVFHNFLLILDYAFYGTGFPRSVDKPNGHILSESINVNGLVMASVPSKTFENIGHSVVMNLDGLVVHDPNPNKLWQDINVLQSGELKHWSFIGPKGMEKEMEKIDGVNES